MKDGNFWIVITEDQEKDSQRLSSFIRRYGKENGLTIEITEFTDGAQLLEHYDKRFDILFMDIGLPQISGMAAAEKVREIDDYIPIIFTTNMAQYAIRGYEVAAIGFMLKPIPYYQFKNYLMKAIAICRKNQDLLENSVITLGGEKNFKRVPTDDIIYIMKDKNYIDYHLTGQEVFRERGTFKAVIPRFQHTTIKQLASGCMVNLRYVQKKEGNDVYLRDIVISITMPFRKTFTQELMDYMRGI